MLRTALTLTALATAVPAAANTYYTARPTAEPQRARLVTRGTVWRCDAGVCTAPRGEDRDAVACELAAKGIGELASFSAGGAAFDAEALARCNARAR